MEITPIKTRTFLPPQDDVLAALDAVDLTLAEGSVVAVSAKVVAIHQGRCVPMPEEEIARRQKKDELIIADAERYLLPEEDAPYPRTFTIYEGTFCSASGIDESNGNGYFILLPKESSEFASELRNDLKEKYNLSDVGVVVIDSRSYPMRNGTIGVSIGYAGFKAEYDYRGMNDIFGRAYKNERINVPDCLASTAVIAMGEGGESTPVVVMKNIPHIEFTETDTNEDILLSLKVPMEQDVFASLYKNKDWKKGGRYTI